MHTIRCFTLVLALAAALPAVAGKKIYPVADPTYQAECATCHVAYPPQLLPARSWRALMAGLDKHFGTDASLDPPTAARITAYLEQHAGRDRTGSRTPLLRITETRWFKHEHDEVPARLWEHPKVKSPANCGACHGGADQGNYDDDVVRLPE